MLSALSSGLDELERDFQRVARSRAWRIGHATTSLARRVRRRRTVTSGAVEAALQRIEEIRDAAGLAAGAATEIGHAGELADERPEAARERAEACANLARRVRGRLGPLPLSSDPPTVSIVVVSRRGQPRLERLIHALRAHTTYPAYELVVVDLDADDGTIPWLHDAAAPMETRVVPAARDLGLGEALNLGAREAVGDLLMFLDAEVEPFEAGWLSELVHEILAGSTAAAPTLVRHGAQLGSFDVHSLGIGFRTERGEQRAFNVGEGLTLHPDTLGETQARAALSSAAMLVRRDAFEQVGGFSGRYRHGYEDVDLCLGLVALNELVICSGRSVLLRRGANAESPAATEVNQITRTVNERVFSQRWGSRLRREYRLARLRGDRRWTDGRAPHAGIEVSPDDRSDALGLGAVLERRDWHVTYLDRFAEGGHIVPVDLDYLVALTEDFDARQVDPRIVTVAWVRDDAQTWLERPWFDRFDLLLASSDEGVGLIKRRTGRPVRHFELELAQLLDALVSLESELSFCIKISAPDWDQAHRSGDLHFAEALRSALQRRGSRCHIQVLTEWNDPVGHTYDVAVVLRGRRRYHPTPGQFNVLWNISHPDALTAAECEIYDLVAVASPSFAEAVRRRTSTPVVVLEQATDPWRFYPDRVAGDERDGRLVFVGNSRGVRRKVLDDLLPTDLPITVYGGGWDDLIDSELIAGDYLDTAGLRQIYSSGAIILNDHWEDMRAQGFISNRVYDAIACGAFVISDDVPGMEERFGGAAVAYTSRRDLHALARHFLEHPGERRARAAAGQGLVIAEHTFDRRVDVLLDSIAQTMAGMKYSPRVVPDATP